MYEIYWDQVSRKKTLIMDKYEEGKAEGKAKIAINMLKANRSIDEIALFIGLTQETIEQFKNER